MLNWRPWVVGVGAAVLWSCSLEEGTLSLTSYCAGFRRYLSPSPTPARHHALPQQQTPLVPEGG